MKNKLTVFLLVLTFAPTITFGQATNAQLPAVDWQELHMLQTGKPILVQLKDGPTLEAVFIGIRKDRLKVSDADGLTTGSYEQKDVKRVYLAEGHGSRKRRAKIGSIVGALAGFLIGGAVSVKIDDSSARNGKDSVALPVGMGFGLAGGAAGYGIGYALGGTRKGKVLYETK